MICFVFSSCRLLPWSWPLRYQLHRWRLRRPLRWIWRPWAQLWRPRRLLRRPLHRLWRPLIWIQRIRKILCKFDNIILQFLMIKTPFFEERPIGAQKIEIYNQYTYIHKGRGGAKLSKEFTERPLSKFFFLFHQSQLFLLFRTPTLRATVTPSPTTPDGSEAPSKLILIN